MNTNKQCLVRGLASKQARNKADYNWKSSLKKRFEKNLPKWETQQLDYYMERDGSLTSREAKSKCEDKIKRIKSSMAGQNLLTTSFSLSLMGMASNRDIRMISLIDNTAILSRQSVRNAVGYFHIAGYVSLCTASTGNYIKINDIFFQSEYERDLDEKNLYPKYYRKLAKNLKKTGFLS